ncbi:P-loop containing nucleoside triphosphate hydrolase protein [Diaporthe eres]|nr:P-loop containing nucleoside triphosphate hydrolase protein [Diaporthe eres]
MDFSGCLNEGPIEPAVVGCRGNFDFTIKFEKIFFSLIPSTLFIVACAPRLAFLWRRKALVGGKLLCSATLSLLSALQLALFVLSIVNTGAYRSYFVPASALTLVSGLGLIVLSLLEHARSPRPSILISFYLALTLLLDVAQTRTLCPEETSGLFGLGAFIWLNRLFLSGYAKVLKVGELYPLDPAMCATNLDKRLARHWQNSTSPSRSKKYGLARALMKALAVPILLPVVPRATMAAFQFSQSPLINALLSYLEQPNPSKNVGYGLIGATVLIYLGIAVTFALYWYYQERAMYMARGALVAAIYKKTTEVGLPAADNSALTLMSGDIERIIVGFLNILELWANTAQVAIACWLLSQQNGLAFLAPWMVVGVCAVCSTILARLTGPRQKVWMEEIQRRVGFTSTVVGQMKNLKMSGLAAPVGKLIQQMRIDELRAGARFRMILSFTATLGVTPLCISPVMAFAFASRTLGVRTIFTSMSYIVLLATPLSVLFQSIPTLMAAFTCLNRIQVFLESDARRDFRPDRRVLSSIDLKIPSAALPIIVGPVASGKSTLCKALLGETLVAQRTTRTGFSPMSTRVGYCDQAPYLSNATIRENIVGFSEFEKDRYDEAIGADGITLSGGQKQRVCLARALYHDTDVVICDDVLRGLDADTEDNVFRKVFSANGVLSRRKATVVLSTHSVRYLPFADHIIALDENGTISEQGTFQQLVVNRGYVYGLNVEHSTDQHSVDGESLPTGATKHAEESKPAAAIAPRDANKAENEHSRMFGDLQVYKHYFARIGISSHLAFLVSAVAWGFFYSFPTVWLTFWSDDITSSHPDHSNSFFLGLYALFQICTPISLLFMSLICFRTMVHQSGSRLHQDALNTVISAPLRFFSRTDTGTITNLFSQYMTLVDGRLPMALTNLSLYVFSSLGQAAVIATSSPYLAVTFPLLLALLYIIQKFYLRTSRQMRLLDLETKGPLYSHFIDTMKGTATICAFGWIPENVHLNKAHLDTSQRPAYLLAIIQRWLGFVLRIIVALLAIAIVTLATQLRSNTAFTGASPVTLMSFAEGLMYVITMYTLLETSIGAVARLKDFSEKVKSEGSGGETLVPSPLWPQGAVKLDNVSATYGDVGSDSSASSNTNAPEGENAGSHTIGTDLQSLALKNLNLDIRPGEKVAICGRSGSGKSSIISLLLRLLDPLPSCADGIFIDGTPLSLVNRTTLRERIITIPQEVVFLPDGTSSKMNLDPFSVSSEDDCWAVLDSVGVRNLVEDHGGLAAEMAVDMLSQGQKQLFSLARALLRHKVRCRHLENDYGETGAAQRGVLLLDEFSSGVDYDTDRAMQKIIREEFGAYTVIMVSHRLEMVMDFDRVVMMDAGSVVETGRPSTLIEKEGSKFRDLWMVGREKA